MNFFLESVGCKLNQSEIETLARRFIGRGHQVVATPEEADVCVLNSCAVTHIAARKSRQAARRLRRRNPAAWVVVTGCYAQVAPDDLSADIVVGNAQKERLVERVLGEGHPCPPTLPPLPPTLPQSRTRAFVKIQDGCDNHCTYCITRIARGPQRSRPRADVLAEVRSRVKAGYQEVVLTGVHIGGYGRDRRQPHRDESLWRLVEAILSQTEVRRLRLSSIEPWDVTPDVFCLWQDARLCRHLHLPLQSGCDEILHRMGRRYTTGEFARLVQAARAAIPDVAITTDIIVGFPGETETHFATSLAFVKSIGFARGHVFPYSARPGTPAASLPHQVAPPEKQNRAARMREVVRCTATRFRERFVGQTVKVLWEHRRNGLWRGLTDNYTRVTTHSEQDLAGKITPVRLTAVTDGAFAVGGKIPAG